MSKCKCGMDISITAYEHVGTSKKRKKKQRQSIKLFNRCINCSKIFLQDESKNKYTDLLTSKHVNLSIEEIINNIKDTSRTFDFHNYSAIKGELVKFIDKLTDDDIKLYSDDSVLFLQDLFQSIPKYAQHRDILFNMLSITGIHPFQLIDALYDPDSKICYSMAYHDCDVEYVIDNINVLYLMLIKIITVESESLQVRSYKLKIREYILALATLNYNTGIQRIERAKPGVDSRLDKVIKTLSDNSQYSLLYDNVMKDMRETSNLYMQEKIYNAEAKYNEMLEEQWLYSMYGNHGDW